MAASSTRYIRHSTDVHSRYEIRDIRLPDRVQDAMQMQVLGYPST